MQSAAKETPLVEGRPPELPSDRLHHVWERHPDILGHPRIWWDDAAKVLHPECVPLSFLRTSNAFPVYAHTGCESTVSSAWH